MKIEKLNVDEAYGYNLRNAVGGRFCDTYAAAGEDIDPDTGESRGLRVIVLKNDAYWRSPRMKKRKAAVVLLRRVLNGASLTAFGFVEE